jgi:hypothetical protein
MAARLDIAGLIVALLTVCISVNPAAQAFFYRLYRWIMCIAQPTNGSCRRMLWSDVPDGLLHLCNPHYCEHENTRQLRPHGSVGCCWDDTIGQAFNRVWYLINTNPTIMRARKPSQLSLQEEYIQTDVHTLKAYLMLTSEICHKCETPDLATLLEIRTFDGISTVHLKATVPVPINPKLTKFEIDRFIEGYPPFYRSTFETTRGVSLNHPIEGTDDFGKGAWVLAVGMTTTNGPICAVHNMQRVTHEKPEAYWKGTLVMTAFKMIRHTLSEMAKYEEEQGPHPRPSLSKTPWSVEAIYCYDKIIDPEFSAQPKALKYQQIEESALFKYVIGDCPCTSKCLGKEPHSVYSAPVEFWVPNTNILQHVPSWPDI